MGRKKDSTAVEFAKILADAEIGSAEEQPIRIRLMRVQRGWGRNVEAVFENRYCEALPLF
jgi:hypothetical protein